MDRDTAPLNFEILDAPEPDLRLVTVEGFLNRQEVEAVHAVARHPGAWEIFDRHGGLKFQHHVWRIEQVLVDHVQGLYDKLTTAAWQIDQQVWDNFKDYAYPEIEYIEYDTEKLGGPGSIAKHVDNDSLVSMVVLLTDRSGFEGGVNWFKSKPPRKLRLREVGDAVFFYGHKCEHWISPVTSGRRAVLQMELRRGEAPDPSSHRGQNRRGGRRGGSRRGRR